LRKRGKEEALEIAGKRRDSRKTMNRPDAHLRKRKLGLREKDFNQPKRRRKTPVPAKKNAAHQRGKSRGESTFSFGGDHTNRNWAPADRGTRIRGRVERQSSSKIDDRSTRGKKGGLKAAIEEKGGGRLALASRTETSGNKKPRDQ